MKVYELMEALSKMPSGANVEVAANSEEDCVGVEEVTDFDEESPNIVGIIGNKPVDPKKKP